MLHTNDHHGRFWANADGEGGLAARQTLIDSVRSEVAAAGGHTLLLDGGDVNTGVPESDLQNAEPDFKGMDRLRYDAMAIQGSMGTRAMWIQDSMTLTFYGPIWPHTVRSRPPNTNLAMR